MLFLLFEIGEARYALETAAVLEIVPCVALRVLPHAPPGVAGLLNYHSAPVPVLDLCALATGQPARTRFSTRLILVRTPPSVATSGQGVVGLLAERATSILRREPGDFTRTGLRVSDAPFLGPVTTDAQGFIHRVGLEGLFTGAVRDLLAPALEDRQPC